MHCVILVGIPGSGKSTICKNWYPSYVRINQDTLGSREECIKAMSTALEANKNVIVDRVNATPAQRKFWIDLALQYGAETVTALVLEVDAEECVSRIHERRDHETIKLEMPIDKKREIVHKFQAAFQYPTLGEGFSTVIIHQN